MHEHDHNHDEKENMEEKIEKTIKAGKIAEEVRNWINIKPGDKIVDIADRGEAKIKELGGGLAFPNNISRNEFAAHDSARLNDDRVIEETDVVKFDMGVHIDGYIVDSGKTFDFSGEHGKLIDTVKLSLENGISKVKAGINTAEISNEIGKTLKEGGFRAIENLTGHNIERYVVHAGKYIQNHETRSGFILEEGDIIAIEPFATYQDGIGHVVEQGESLIYSFVEEAPTRNMAARKLLEMIYETHQTMPFASRWYLKSTEDRIAFSELVRNGSLTDYPPLREKANKIVAQFEHTILVEKDAGKILF